ncbi:glycylpeptide N-tetradecanoyltransferase [Naganishia albida]|nr:glycylpeptide N-tetradecanoyltransferase [Naganishia albida]
MPPIDDPKNLRDLLDKFSDLQAEADAEAEAEAGGEGSEDNVEHVDHVDPSSKPKKKKKKSKGKASKAIQKLKDMSTGTVPPELVAQVQSQIANDTPAGSAPPQISEKEIKKALAAVDLMKILQGKQALGNTSNTKDLGEHKFWKTQPVIQAATTEEAEGPIDPPKTVADVRRDPLPLPSGYEWSTIDITSPAQLSECQTLLSENYVEDPDASFRLGYTDEFLRWALCPPGYEKEWHIGIRVSGNKKLVAFISGIPMHAQVRENSFTAAEINFLCAHKKLRNKRLAPVLIKEVTRRVNLRNIWQAVYTAGVVIPTPISTCRYYHRNLNPAKLVDIGFTPVGRGETISRLVRKYALPATPLTPGWREMTAADVPAVGDLLRRYMRRFEMQQVFRDDDEVTHWFLSGRGEGENKDGCGRKGQVVWAYVVEDPETKRITDFTSFYSLPSLIMKHPTHKSLQTAYAFYYATESAPLARVSGQKDSPAEKARLGERLNALTKDCLIVAKAAGFDVFNALSLMDNNLFLHDQLFGPGDGYLNYYLYNWRCAPIDGARDDWKTKETSKIGVVML